MKLHLPVIVASLTWASQTAASPSEHNEFLRHESSSGRMLEEGEPGPLKVGDEFEMLINQNEDSQILPNITDKGATVLFKIKLREKATYITVHFANFDLAPGCVAKISGKTLQGGIKQEYEMTGKGKMEAGTFWAEHVKGDTFFLKAKCGPGQKAKDAARFTIDEVAVGFVEEAHRELRRMAICGANDKKNAVCYQSSFPTEYSKSRAVARLLIQGSSLCTGWLASPNSHLITNEHCVADANAAINTDYEFMAEANNCADGNCQLCHPGIKFSGASFIQGNAALDYTLVQLNGNPAATYGYLEIDDRAADVGEQIYIPQYPGGRAKELGTQSTDSADSADGLCHVNSVTASACGASGYNDVGYMCDTEGGSSGSPVLATSSHKVIALHHCAYCYNRGVPIRLICDQGGAMTDICNPSSPCTVDGDCDDGVSCTTDICEGGTCVNTGNCQQDGSFCNGIEYCDSTQGACVSPGDPCGNRETCNEGSDTCEPLICGSNKAKCSTREDCCSLNCNKGRCRGN